jgi:HK97 family phage major capsid protein
MSNIQNIQELGTAFEQFKGYHAKSLDEKIGKTEATLKDEIRKSSEDSLAKYDQIKADLKAKEESQKALQDSIDDLATKMNRTGTAYGDSPEKVEAKQKGLDYFNRSRYAAWAGKAMSADKTQPIDGEMAAQYKAAHERWIRYGDQAVSSAEYQKAMAVGSEPDGGAWIVPPERSQQIISRTFETTPMRQIANVVTITAHSFLVPQDPNRLPTGGWVSEMQPRIATATPGLGVKEIVPQEIYAQPSVTQIMMEDAGFDVENYIGNKAAEAFALDSNSAFVSGDGNGKPKGFLSYSAGSNGDGTNKWSEIEQIGSGTSGVFTYLGLIKALTSFRGDKYNSGLTWLFKRSSVASLMTIQNPAGQFVFTPIVGGQFNGTPLLGADVVYANDMPAIAAGALAGAIGNFKMGYTIVDRVGISTIRDNLTAKPFTVFYMRTRVGGDVVDFDAIKLIKLT